MPLTLNVGLSRKIGLPDYGSLGASCHVQVELEASLLKSDLEAFQQQVRNAYVACAQAVTDELARHQRTSPTATRSTDATTATPATARGQANGHRALREASHSHRATEKQLDYAHQLAGLIKGFSGRKLDQLAQRMHGLPLTELNSLQASGLIDMLKAIKAGDATLSAALEGSREAA